MLDIDEENPPSKIAKTVHDVKEKLNDIKIIGERYNSLSEIICNHLEETDVVRKKIADYVDQIDTLQHTVKYLGTVQEIDDLRYF